MLQEKKCTKCNENKPLTEYHKAKSKDGLTSYCKSCNSKICKAYRDANAEALKIKRDVRQRSEEGKAKRKIYTANNPEKVKATAAAYREANRAELNRKQEEDRRANPEKYRERAKEYRAKYPEKEKARNKIYRQVNDIKLKEDQRLYREGHREEAKASSKQYRLDNLEECMAYDKAYALSHKAEKTAYYLANKDRRADVGAQYYRDNKPAISARIANYQKNNPERMRIWANTRRTRMSEAGGSYTLADVEQMRIDQDGMCTYCWTSILKIKDDEHKTPVSRGGSSNPENMTLCCDPCNSQKFMKTHLEYLALRERLGIPTREYAYTIHPGDDPKPYVRPPKK